MSTANKVETEDTFFTFRSSPAELLPATDNKPRTFKGIAFSGDLITDWYRPVVFDMASTAMNDRIPALLNHDKDKPIGVITGYSFDNATGMNIEGTFLKNVDSVRVIDDAEAGLLWQMSVGIRPGSVEEVRAGASVQVNGRTFSGPIEIWRNNRVREVSFCTVGADDKTSASIFSLSNPSEEQTMDLTQAQARIGELEQQIADLNKQNAAFAAAKRESEINALMAETGVQLDEATKTAFAAMPDSAFAAAANFAKAQALKTGTQGTTKPAIPAHLTKPLEAGREAETNSFDAKFDSWATTK